MMVDEDRGTLRASLLYLPEIGKQLSNDCLKYKFRQEFDVSANVTTVSEKIRLNGNSKDDLDLTKAGTIRYEEALFRANVEFALKKNKTEVLIRQFCSPTKRKIFGESWIQLENEVFNVGIIPSHLSLNVSPFSLGCFVSMNTFVEHFASNWSVKDDAFNIGVVRADFVHDLKKLFINFSVSTKAPNGTKRKIRTISTEYRLEILYTSIQRILVCMKATKKVNGKDLMVYDVYLKLAGSPFVKVKQTNGRMNEEKNENNDEDKLTKSDKNDYYLRDDDRYENEKNDPKITWLRVEEFGEEGTQTRCSKQVIGMARVIKLTLVNKTEGVPITAMEIIGQLVSCCKFATAYFTPMEEVVCKKAFASPSVPKKYFDGLYGLKCVLSHGYDIADELKICRPMDDLEMCAEKSRNGDKIKNGNLLSTINNKLKKCAEVDENALENSLYDIQRMLNQGEVFRFEKALDYLFLKYNEKNVKVKSEEECQKSKKESLVHLRRAVLTPTRLIFLPPLPQSMNYLLRSCDPKYCMRLTLRDDDFDQLTFKLTGSIEDRDAFLNKNFLPTLQGGIKIGDRHYEFFGSSTSQLREHGILMYAADPEGRTAASIRESMGELKALIKVPKYMARMGQNLSQSIARVTVDRKYCSEKPEDDIERGGYNFTDGVGRISKQLMEECYSKLSLPEGQKPSAIQIRYGGCKGMLVLDDTLEGKQIIFRKSQWKYDSNSTSLEILKISKPRHVYLNRPFITILEQMGVPFTVFVELQTKTLEGLINSLLDSKAASKLLHEKALLRLPYNRLHRAGFDLSMEPFFRTMTMALYKAAIEQLKQKARIDIPFSQGRTMFGVVDETGTLKYGQIFVQYTETTDEGEVCTTKKILEGEVLVSKNPCMHPGDVRKLQALNVKALHHITDCIVFPSQGHRPHPDEMAGSDLDGDEYSVIWYKPLYFDRQNYDAMDYRSDNKSSDLVFLEEDSHAERVRKMGKFLCYYIRSDSVGLIASAHLASADQDTIFSPKCMRIAKKFSVTLDFAKSGEPADLDKEERVKRYPDFMEKMSEKETYLSHRALGVLYRNCRRIDLASNVLSDEVAVELDKELVMEGSEEYLRKARSVFEEYTNFMEEPSKLFCITSEGELMSGATCSKDQFLKGRNSKENLELSLESYIPKVMKQMKEQFYEEFSECTNVQNLCNYYTCNRLGGDGRVNRVTCSSALSILISKLSRGSDERLIEDLNLGDILERVLRKGSAWYQVAYLAKKEGSSIFLGLPWCVTDVLILLKLRNKMNMNRSLPLFMKEIENVIVTEKDKIYSFLSLKETDDTKRLVKALLDRWLTHHMRTISLRTNERAQEIFAQMENVFQVVSDGGLPTSSPAVLLMNVLKRLAQYTFTTGRVEHDSSQIIKGLNIRKELGLLAVMALANLTSTGKLWGKSNQPDENNIFGCSFLDDHYREEIYLRLDERKDKEFFNCMNRYVHEVEGFLKRMSGIHDIRCDFKQVINSSYWYVILSILGKRLNIELLKDYMVRPNFKDKVIENVKRELKEEKVEYF